MLLGSLIACGSTKVHTSDDNDVAAADAGLPAALGLFPATSQMYRSLTTSTSVCCLPDSDSSLTAPRSYCHPRLSLDKDSISGNGSGSLSLDLLRSARCRSNLCLVSCTSYSAQPHNRDSAWSSQSQASSYADTASVLTGMLHTALLQLQLDSPNTQGCETQPNASSPPTRELSKASHPSINCSERSAISFTASGEHSQIPNCMSPRIHYDVAAAAATQQFLMQPYEEEKRTWLQMKWQQQQDWLEMQQQGMVHPSSPRQPMQFGSRSLNVRAAQQPARQCVGLEREDVRGEQHFL